MLTITLIVCPDASNVASFNLGLEGGPHIAISRSIRGDFSMLTAPSGKSKFPTSMDGSVMRPTEWTVPVFFLHHGQLDRLRWVWQRFGRERRERIYGGKKQHGSTENASELLFYRD